jgi:hypothetical protein
MKYDFNFLDNPSFSFADLTRLTDVHPTNIHALVTRGHFKPQLKQRVGAGGNREAQTYTGRDVLRLLLIAYLVHYRIDDAKFMARTVRELDHHIAAFVEFKTRHTRTFYPEAYEPGDDPFESPVTVFAWAPGGGSVQGDIRDTLEEFRHGGPWCYLTLDLHTLVEKESVRMAKYLRLVSKGVKRSKAARDSAGS